MPTRGGIDLNNLPDGLQYMLDCYAAASPARTPVIVRRTVRAPIAPLIQTKWDQYEPYNLFTPLYSDTTKNVPTGCVATAMAQMMKYWNWPQAACQPIPGYRPPYNPNDTVGPVPATTFDWANMLPTYTGGESETQKNAVAKLMEYCGKATQMHYDFSYGETSSIGISYAFKTYFDYDPGVQYVYREHYSYAQWVSLLYNELAEGRPVCYSSQSAGGGHAFVCDGYDTDDYFHFNWGWSGENDGYYKLSNLVPGSGGAGGGDYEFNEDQDVIIGIVPDKKDMPEVTVTWSVNGETTETIFHEEDALVLPADPASCAEGVEFVGWTTKSELNGEKPADLFKVAAGKIVSAAVTYYAVFATVEGEGGVAVEDQLTLATTGVSGNSYAIWSGKTVNSSAVYAGNTAGGNSSIQLRSKNGNSGLFTTASGGKLSKVIVDFNENTADSRQLDIYGKDAPYSDASDLFNSSKGTKIGSIVYGTTTELEVDGEYTYVGVRSNNGAIYLNSITFVWGGGATYTNYTTNCSGDQTSVVNAAADQSLATKVVRDGQVVIIRGNEVFNLLGVRLN